MIQNLLIVFCIGLINISNVYSQSYNASEVARWKKQAQKVKIIRDEWGIPHIYGKTDADAVFGLMYAQAEENLPQVEKNFLEMLGRSAEMEGKKKLYDDLLIRLIQDSAEAIKDFEKSPEWLKKLLIAHADGLNYYIYLHPKEKPSIIQYYKPWYHLMWTDGSVSPTKTAGIKPKDLAKIYPIEDPILFQPFTENNKEEALVQTGSNGFAIAPMHSKNGNALLYINPHVPFYFRSEMHMISEEGLNAYGAVTWGQMFIYQGFNEKCGWMHTSGYADVADLYEEKVVQKNNQWYYLYEKEQIPFTIRNIPIKWTENGTQKETQFTTYQSLHGPVMTLKDNKWISIQENNRSLDALMECWLRTKSKGLADYTKAMEILANNSNNTVFADAAGNIAYWHGNFIPKRNNTYDFSKPLDGSIQATRWLGKHRLDEIVQSINPINGWLQNCNSTPFQMAGKNSPIAKNYPKYMAPDGENGRGVNAVRLLEKIDKISLDELIEIGYNKRLIAFDILLPNFIKYANSIQKTSAEAKALQYVANWNHDADKNSIGMTIAIEWAKLLNKELPLPKTEEEARELYWHYQQMDAQIDPLKKWIVFQQSLEALEKQFGKWEIAWGEINRYQRINTGDSFQDNSPSWPVAQTSSKWGQLPAFESQKFGSTTKYYGYSGNSFVAAVSFGKKVEAKTIITGGQSRWANQSHFTDQAEGFIEGKFKTIHYYQQDVMKHKVSSYKPGELR